METILRKYVRRETEEYAEEIIELVAIGWESYSIRINGWEAKRVIGLEYAFIALDEFVDEDSPDYVLETET